ncbi:MAG: phasin family protein [Magnetospiraceae bacterium]
MATKKTTSTDFDPISFWKDMDPSKFFGSFDPAKMMSEFTKVTGDMKVPTVDFAPFVDIQRKNVEAVIAANKLAAEGVQAVYMRQAELQKQVSDELTKALDMVKTASSPQDTVAAQADLLKDSFEKALTNLRELNEMLVKSNTEALDTVNKRFIMSLDEFKVEVLKTKA